jgi:hypothetical protein
MSKHIGVFASMSLLVIESIPQRVVCKVFAAVSSSP